LISRVDKDKWLWMIRALDAKLIGAEFRKVSPEVKNLFTHQHDNRIQHLSSKPRDLDNCVYCSFGIVSEDMLRSLSIHDPFRIVSLPRGDGTDTCYDVVELYDLVTTALKSGRKRDQITIPYLVAPGSRQKFTTDEVEHIIQWHNGYQALKREMVKRKFGEKEKQQIIMLGQHMYMYDMQNEDPAAQPSSKDLHPLVSSVLSMIPKSIQDGARSGWDGAKDVTLKLVRYVASNPHWIRICMLIADIVRMVVCTFITLYYAHEYMLGGAPVIMVVAEFLMSKLMWLADGYFAGLGERLKETSMFQAIMKIFASAGEVLKKYNLPIISSSIKIVGDVLVAFQEAWVKRDMTSTVLTTTIISVGVAAALCPASITPLILARFKWKFLQTLVDTFVNFMDTYQKAHNDAGTLELGPPQQSHSQSSKDVSYGDWSKSNHQLRIFIWIMGRLCPATGGGRKICEAGMGLLSRMMDSTFFVSSIGTAILDIVLYARAIRSGDVDSIKDHASSCAISVLSYQFSAKGCLCWGTSSSSSSTIESDK